MTGPLLSVKNLKVHFPIKSGGLLRTRYTPLKAVNGVSLDIHEGETVGIVGESGCGKSTLGRAILQLIKPTDGHVVWLGEDLVDLDKEALNRKRAELQIVFQDPLSSHNPRMNIEAIIGEPLTVFAPEMSKQERQAAVFEMMGNVGLRRELAGRYPHELSGGQCQRVSIARAMILKPKLVVCDEPVSALDVSTQAQIISLIKRLQKEYGISIVFISHDLSVVWHLCQRIMVMYLGELIEVADRQSIFKAPYHPYTQALIQAIPIPDPKKQRAKTRLQIKGEIPSPLNLPSGCVFRTRCPIASPVCIKKAPELTEVERNRHVACHHWDQQRQSSAANATKATSDNVARLYR